MIRETNKCRVCGSTSLSGVLDLGTHALTGRFPRPNERDPLSGPLEVVLCGGPCGLLQLRHSYPPEEMYGDTYGYRSSNNTTMRAHLKEKIYRLSRTVPLHTGDAVLDIGCNDGTTLGFYEKQGLRRFGIDPSSERYAGEFPKDARLIVDFFSAKAVSDQANGQKFKIVTSIAMFYDLEDPLAFMREVAHLLDPDGVWETEQAYMPSMLTRRAYDSVCHEHISYFSLRSIKWMSDRSALKIIDVGFNEINGGSFYVVFARQDSPRPEATSLIRKVLLAEESAQLHALDPYARFADRVSAHREQLRRMLHEMREKGRLVLGYGASTKGNVVLQYCGITRELLPAIAERYPMKFGRVTPGTRIPIISEEEAKSRHPARFLVLPWYFRDEILRRERQFLEHGGELAFVLPDLDVIGR